MFEVSCKSTTDRLVLVGGEDDSANGTKPSLNICKFDKSLNKCLY